MDKVIDKDLSVTRGDLVDNARFLSMGSSFFALIVLSLSDTPLPLGTVFLLYYHPPTSFKLAGAFSAVASIVSAMLSA